MSHNLPHEVPAPYLIAAVLQSDTLLGQVQRELYRALPGITIDHLRQFLREDILREEVTVGIKAEEAEALLNRVQQLRAKGLSMTQTLKVVTGQVPSDDDSSESVYQILLDDKRLGVEGG